MHDQKHSRPRSVCRQPVEEQCGKNIAARYMTARMTKGPRLLPSPTYENNQL
jgi:hypothetical protein